MSTTTIEHIRQRVLPALAEGASFSAQLLPVPDVLQPAPAQQPWQAMGSSAEQQRCLDPPCRIRAHLLIGSRETEASASALQAAGVTHVLQAGGELTPSHPGLFAYKHLSLGDEDDEDIVAAFQEAFDFIENGRGKGAVLVHCAQGMSRSGAICIGYVMWRERLSYDTALAHVQDARPVVSPNDGFVLQLREFERLGCNLAAWRGWDKQMLERCFRRSNVSGRRVVHGFSDVIRRFHVHNLTDDDTVFFDSTVML